MTDRTDRIREVTRALLGSGFDPMDAEIAYDRDPEFRAIVDGTARVAVTLLEYELAQVFTRREARHRMEQAIQLDMDPPGPFTL